MKKIALSQEQLGIALSCLEGTLAYNLPLLIPVGESSYERVYDALSKIFKAHPSLNLRLSMNEVGTIEQWVEDRPVALERIQKLDRSTLVQPFVLWNAPLYRASYIEDKQNYLFIDFHHVMMDGFSIRRFLDDLALCLEGKAPREEEQSLLDDARRKEEERSDTRRYENDRRYFESSFSGIDVDNLPMSDKDEGTKRYAKIKVDLKDLKDEDVALGLKKFGVRRSSFFYGAFAYTLGLYSFSEEASFSSVTNGRNDATKESYGMFVRTFPCYVSNVTKGELSDYLQGIESQKNATLAASSYSFADLVKDTGYSSDILFSYQGDDYYSICLGGKVEAVEVLPVGDGKGTLTLELFRKNGGYFLDIEYRADLYGESSMRHFGESFAHVCAQMLAKDRLEDIDPCSEQDKRLLHSFNSSNLEEYDLSRDFVDDIRDAIATKGDALALISGDTKITYRELGERATRLTDYLLNQHFPKESIVSVLIGRNEFMGIATVGILQAGLAYQPLDPSYPDERLSFMIEDAEARLVICDRGLESRIPSYKGPILFTDELIGLPLLHLPQPKSSPEDLYIMLYTSGSTGKPKGVQLCHGNISAFVQYQRKRLNIQPDDSFFAYASYGFDANMYDIYGALCNGLPLYIIDEEMRLNLPALNHYLEENHIRYGLMTTQVGRQFVEFEENHSLKALMVGGEKLVPVNPPKHYRLINGYGPTECTIVITMFDVDRFYHRVPVGKGLEINHLYVLDKAMRPVPFGAPGYLYASGPQVARGYKNRPEENKKAFLDNPFEGGAYQKMYYTGDVVRFLEDGTIDFIGRKDGQVKIRGFRIELSEVERVIREYPGVEDATVNAFPSPSGGMFIAGYVVSKENLNLDDIKYFIGERKPYYMVPEAMMQLDAIPLNQNQKVNKRALPVPTLSSKKQEAVLPRNEKETVIAKVAEKVLGYEGVGVTSDLFESGLTSISSIRFMSLLSNEAGIDLSIKELRENPTIEKIALLSSKVQETFEKRSSYPLTKTQQGIFVEMMGHPTSTMYNIPLVYHLGKGIDVARLAKAIEQAIELHPGIKGHLEMDGTEVNLVPSPMAANVEIIDHDAPNPFVLEPYDLFKGPLYKAKIYQGKEDVLYLDTHHIASDGSSLAVLMEDITLLYEGKQPLGEKISAFDLALLEQKRSTVEELEKQKAYYGALLSGVDSPSLPRKEYDLLSSSAPKEIDYPLDLDAKKAGELFSRLSIGPNAFFNAVFAFALAKWNGNDDALFTSIYSGRDDARSARTVTMLVKTLPVYLAIDPNKGKFDYLREASKQLQSSQEQTLYSFAEIAHDYDIKADVMFAYQGDGFLPSSIGEVPARLELLLGDEAKASFSVDCLYKEGRYSLHFEYPENLYLPETMVGFGKMFGLVASAFLSDGKLGDIALVDGEDEAKLDEYNQTYDQSDQGCYLDYFRKAVKDNPKKKAIIAIDETLTYEEFDARGNQVANALLKLGVKPDEKVICLTKRIANAYVAREGVLKSGAAFLPIDPAYPDERIAYIIEDSEARFVLTTHDIYEAKKDSYGAVTFLLLEDILANESKIDPMVDISPSSLAYCIYTSGSTGKPKGVMIEHHNLYNFVSLTPHNAVAHEYVDDNDVTASLASLSFDLSIQEEFVPFAHGLSNVLASEEEILNPVALASRMIEHGATIITTTPSYVNNVLDIEDVMKAFRLLHNIDLGAEAIPSSLVKKMREKGMGCKIGNGYGPTEATVTCTFDDVVSSRITIGYPLNNVKTFIIDKELRRLPFGAIGELLIGGDGVSRGYIHRDDLNAEKFIEYHGVRAYRSGDLARLNYDGRIEFFGRKDNQVKLRGLRVELDEIENAIASCPGISRAVVLVKESPEEGQYLVGYYLSEKELDASDIKAHISQTLTPYMIPKVLVHLDAIPMTQNGKVDKKKLPEPVIQRGEAKLRKPRNDTQQAIYDIFVHVLGVKELSIDDDFFDLGGSSLSASKVAMLALEKGLPISYGDIFDNPTVSDLAALVLASKKVSETQEEALSPIEEGLEHNVVAEVNDIVLEKKYGSVLLTGATGFLGIHVLEELLRQDDVDIIALVRGSKGLSGKQRLEMLLAYYFDDPQEETLARRVKVVEDDVTSDDLVAKLKDEKFDLLINCAALVKHFASDDSIERVNLGGVKHLIDVALDHKARMVQISTLSVAGVNVNHKFPSEKRIHESEIYFGQDISNKYVNSKIKAEQAMIEAINKRGLDGKIIRVGNLMGRNKDGEFQANSSTNNFMNSLRAYVKLGCFPVSAADATTDFSPIDEVAKTILLLSRAPSKFTIFHSANGHEVEFGDVIAALNEYGYPIEIVSDEVFASRLSAAMADEETNMAVSSLISYDTSTGVSQEWILSDNTFSVKALYRLGYKWPITSESYLSRSIESLATLGFFD